MSDCTSCGESKNGQCNSESCSAPQKLAPNQFSQIKQVIAIMSGKGGVGKSSVTALMAVNLAKKGYKVGIMDADITGPSIPKLFGLHQKPESNAMGIVPVKSKLGISIMSINLFMDNENDPVVWRGPILGSAIQQFWNEVFWGELDYLLLDLPPGTGDVPLTVLQQIPVDGLVIVTSPQDLALMVVMKAVKLAQMLNTPIIGLVQNMDHVVCPKCGEHIHMFGHGHQDKKELLEDMPLLEVLPIDPKFTELSDAGRIEDYESDAFVAIPAALDALKNKQFQ